jgi:Na+/H+ antiporter NhaC
MDFARREIALIVMVIGVAMVCMAAWMDRRRKDRLMPYLIAPLPLKIFGFTIAFIALVVALLPKSL